MIQVVEISCLPTKDVILSRGLFVQLSRSDRVHMKTRAISRRFRVEPESHF